MGSIDSRRSQLLSLLKQGYELTVPQIMERLDIGSKRHVRRIFEQLRDAGVPISTRTEKRIRFFSLEEAHRSPQIQLPPLSERQMLALAVAAEASRPFLNPTPLAGPLGEAFDIVLQAMGPKVFTFEPEEEGDHWHFGGVGTASIHPAIFEKLFQAVHEHRPIRIDYFSAHSGQRSYDRAVEPYGLAVRNGSWILVAHCRERRAVRDFSLAGITRVEIDEAIFERPDDFDLDDYFRSRFSALSGAPTNVRLLVEPDRVPYFHRKKYHPTQRMGDPLEDGRIIVSFRVDGLDEIRSFVQSWGVGLTVLEPLELAEILRREAEEIVNRYAGKLVDE